MKEASPRRAVRLKVITLSASALILVLAGVIAYAWFSVHPVYPSYDPNHPTLAQQKAIDDAMEWREGQNISSGSTVITPAVDPKTGARYTFRDSNIPSGWVVER